MRLAAWLVWAAATTAASADPAPDPPSYGPFVHEFNLTLDPGNRIEAVGPFLWADHTPEQNRWGLSPLLTHAETPDLDSEEFDVLYPLLTYDRFGEEYKLRISFLTTFTGGHNQQEEGVRRFTLFPFIFYQRSKTPEFNYSAVFPIHGTIRDRLNRKEIQFTLFPLYSQTRKRDLVTRNYLYPIYHQRSGDHLEGWQLWPFAGHETREAFHRTNAFGDVEFIPGHDKRFALWPFHLREQVDLGTTNPVTSTGWLPFYFGVRSPARDSDTYLWPLFSVIDDRAKGYKEWQMPFLLVDFARGPGKTTDRIFPFYSRARTRTAESTFLLWPAYKVNRFHAPPLSKERERLFFFLYSDIHETNMLRQTVLRRTDVWPLFTRWKDHEGRERFQALSVIEPILPFNKAIERAYSPLWSVFRHERQPSTGTSSSSLLWNLYRRDTTRERQKTSLCFGLFQYESAPGRHGLRLFYIPIVKPKPTPATATADPRAGHPAHD